MTSYLRWQFTPLLSVISSNIIIFIFFYFFFSDAVRNAIEFQRHIYSRSYKVNVLTVLLRN